MLDQYADISKKTLSDSGAKITKCFEKILIEVLKLFIVIQGRVNFLQMERYSRHDEQTFRNNFECRRSKSVNWLKFNVALAKRYFGENERWAVAIDPSHISKSGNKTPHIGKFWSGCAQAVKHGLEVMGIGLVGIDSNNCIMLRAHQTPGQKESALRDKTLVDHYIGVIKRYRKELLKMTSLIVADAYFSTSTFVEGIKKYGFRLVSRLRDNACLYYLYDCPRTGKRGRPRVKGNRIDLKKLDFTKMEHLDIDGLEGNAYTLIAWSKALKCKIRLVIWLMPHGKRKLFFSNDITLTGEDVLRFYRTRFQIEFCFRDAKQFTGLTHCQARSTWKLDFHFNASFASLNLAKVMMKEIGMGYSMASFKSLMFNDYFTKRIFDASGYRPNQNKINKIFKDLFGLQRKTA